MLLFIQPTPPKGMQSTSQEELNIRSRAISASQVYYVAGVLARALFLTLICALAAAPKDKDKQAPVQYQIPVPPAPDFSALSWLQGEWTGKTLASGPPGDAKLSIEPDLDKHFLILRGEVSLPASPTVPATKETWLGILSPSADGAGFVLRKFSSTGFVTRYRLTINEPEIQLNPEGGEAPPPGWLFRMTWARTGPGEFTETVQTAPPGKAFFD